MPLVDAPRSKGGFALGDYVEVKDRIRMFYEQHPDGRLVTDRAEVWLEVDPPRVVVKALAYRSADDPLPGVGWSWLTLPGLTPYTKGSELENAETSAWGRAIGSLGIGIDKSIASKNEVDAKAGDAAEKEREHTDDGSLIGTVTRGKPPVDLEMRQTPQGPIAGFKLAQGRSGLQVLAHGDLATALHPFLAGLVDTRVSVWGTVEMVPWDKDGKDMPPYKRLNLERIVTPDFVLPAPIDQDIADALDELVAEGAIEVVSEPMFALTDEEKALIAAGTPG